MLMVVQGLVVPWSIRRVGHVIESAGSRKQTKILDHDVISDSSAIIGLILRIQAQILIFN